MLRAPSLGAAQVAASSLVLTHRSGLTPTMTAAATAGELLLQADGKLTLASGSQVPQVAQVHWSHWALDLWAVARVG